MPSTVQTQSGIEQLLHAAIHRPKFLVEQAEVRDYAAEYKRFAEDPECWVQKPPRDRNI